MTPRSLKTKRLLLLLAGIAALFFVAIAILAASGLHDQLGKADIALVLGNTVNPDGTPSPRLRARLDRTLELYQAGWFPEVIVSGGLGKEGFDEAAVMRDYLVARGIPADRIIVDSRGTTTFASATNTLRIMRKRDFHSLLVISQYFHIPRCRLVLGHCGIAPLYSAHAWHFELRDLYSLPRELAGYIAYYYRIHHPKV